ncbi:MAG: hypothetical protein WC443_13460 [Desulfobaccales bacterium]
MRRTILLLMTVGLFSGCSTLKNGLYAFFNAPKTGLEEVHYFPGNSGPTLWEQEAELYRAWNKNHDYPMPAKYIKGAWDFSP